MADDAILRRYNFRLSAEERASYVAGDVPPAAAVQAVMRGETPIPVVRVDALVREAMRRSADWQGSRQDADRWIAPRLHRTLRLTRAEAADAGMWLWLSVRYADFVEWRWSSKDGVAETRWTGGIHKQALARLWWGAELFRNGADYGAVERAFRRQDVINSFLHRPLARCRSLALGIVDIVAPPGTDSLLSSDDVNDLARVLNLATAGAPPEAETQFRRDDTDGYRRWALGRPTEDASGWDAVPVGPPCTDTTPASLAGGLAVAQRAWAFARPPAAPPSN